MGCHFLLQGIFLTQRSNLHLLHWHVGAMPLSHLGSMLERIAISFSSGSSQPGIESVSLISPALASGFFTTIATWEAPLSPRKKQNLFTMALFFQKILSCNNNIRRSIMSNPMDYIACQAPLSMGILLGRILEWVAYRFSRGSS